MALHPMMFSALQIAAKTPAKSSGSAAGTVIYLLFIVVAGYFLWRAFGRNRQQQAARTRDLLANLAVGDEVLTGAGIFGIVSDIDGDRVTIETAPGTRITVLRSTIARRIEEQVPTSDAASLEELQEEPGVVRDAREHAGDGAETDGRDDSHGGDGNGGHGGDGDEGEATR